MVPAQKSRDAVVAYSRKLCEESRALRDTARITVAQAKESVARSYRLATRIKAQKAEAAHMATIVGV
jgi:hypothetical protein